MQNAGDSMSVEVRVRRAYIFFNDTATTEIYTLSLHDALPILRLLHDRVREVRDLPRDGRSVRGLRSEEHTSELQSRQYLVCRLLLEKKTNSSCRSTMLGHSCPWP